MPSGQTALEAIIVERQALMASIDEETDEDQIAELCDDEDRLLLELARRREPDDEAFFDKVGYLMASRVAEFGEPSMRGPFDLIAIALRRHLEQRA